MGLFSAIEDSGGVPLPFANGALPAESMVESAENYLLCLEWKEPDGQVLSLLVEPGIYQYCQRR